MKRVKFFIAIVFFFLTGPGSTACNSDSLKLWKNVRASKIRSLGQPSIKAKKFSVLKLNKVKLDKIISSDSSVLQITLPATDGKSYRTFLIEKSHVMAPELEKKFPEIKSYSGYDKMERSSSLRLDINPAGLHAMIRSTEGEYFIEPFNKGKQGYYILFLKGDVEKNEIPPYANPDVVK